jgi:hypothetical protein
MKIRTRPKHMKWLYCGRMPPRTVGEELSEFSF